MSRSTPRSRKQRASTAIIRTIRLWRRQAALKEELERAVSRLSPEERRELEEKLLRPEGSLDEPALFYNLDPRQRPLQKV